MNDREKLYMDYIRLTTELKRTGNGDLAGFALNLLFLSAACHKVLPEEQLIKVKETVMVLAKQAQENMSEMGGYKFNA